MRKTSSDKSKTGVSRRSVLKGTAAVAGAAAATTLSGGFPTVWAQDIKDITVRTVGMAVSNMKPLEDMANEALDFQVRQTAAEIPAIVSPGQRDFFIVRGDVQADGLRGFKGQQPFRGLALAGAADGQQGRDNHCLHRQQTAQQSESCVHATSPASQPR